MLPFLIIFVSAYIIGSIPTAILTGKFLRGWQFDIRNEGSGNAGGTNVFRVLGMGPGLVVTLFDIFKGFAVTFWISAWYPAGTLYIDATVIPIIAGITAVCGHIWSIFANFRGGKGVGTAAGMVIALYPIAAAICITVFSTIVYLTRYVSLSSMIAGLCLPIILWISQAYFDQKIADAFFQFSIIIPVLIIYTHRVNIRRLLEGTENRIGKK